jgi:hypothetical protein
MGEATAFDMILGIMVGSIVSRAITGNAPLVPALAATVTLIALHSVLSAVACRWHGRGEMIDSAMVFRAASGRDSTISHSPIWKGSSGSRSHGAVP